MVFYVGMCKYICLCVFSFVSLPLTFILFYSVNSGLYFSIVIYICTNSMDKILKFDRVFRFWLRYHIYFLYTFCFIEFSIIYLCTLFHMVRLLWFFYGHPYPDYSPFLLSSPFSHLHYLYFVKWWKHWSLCHFYTIIINTWFNVLMVKECRFSYSLLFSLCVFGYLLSGSR